MIYFFLGDDGAAKNDRIAGFKKKLLSHDDAPQFDYDLLHAHKLAPALLKKTLLALPTLSKKRLVVIRNAQKLTAHHKKIIAEVLNDADYPCELVLDFDSATVAKDFHDALSRVSRTVRFQHTTASNVFDVGRSIAMRKQVDALKLLHGLFAKGEYPPNIIGGLLWSWSQSRNRMPARRFKQGLLAFQEADGNVKRSRLKAQHALEMLVVKLCAL